MLQLTASLQQLLNYRDLKGNLRLLKNVGKPVDFTSNDYLGFARSKQLRADVQEEWGRLSEEESTRFLGATGSRLLTGNHPYCEQLENAIAAYHNAEAGLIFNTGYMANLGVLSAVIRPEDTLLYDTHIHASSHDGMRLSRTKCYPWRHNNLEYLEKRLSNTSGTIFVCIESIYSIDGTIAPLKEICSLCRQFNAHLIVDEAHATGLIGRRGEGLVASLGLEKDVFARIHTFSKALGAHGAIVLGSAVLREYLINYARPFIYSTALPLHVLASVKCAYQRLPFAVAERDKLKSLQDKFITKAQELHLPFQPNITPLFPLYLPGNELVKNLSEILLNNGFDVRPILSPSVKQGRECLRFSLHAFNAEEEIDELLELLAKCGVAHA